MLRAIKNFLFFLTITILELSILTSVFNDLLLEQDNLKIYAAQTTYTSGSGNWTSPITGNITVECWAAGGGGGRGGTTNKYGGGGGGGGQYAIKVIAVTKGTQYAYSVGSAGSGGTTAVPNGGTGGDSTFNTNSVIAKGGTGGFAYVNGRTGGVGNTAGGVGDTIRVGGNGVTGATTYSGGGGGGAGSNTAGGNATTFTGGTGGSLNGGNGGNGTEANAAVGSPGSTYGGGGGGGTKNSNGGNGAGGYIVITYSDNTAPTVTLNTLNGNNFGTDITPTLEFTGNDDLYLDDIEYNIQIDNNSDCSTPILDKVSTTDLGFLNTVSGGDTHPFNSGQKASYTVQSGEELNTGTYYWRVRAIDPGGTNTYGSWSGIYSFTTDTGISITLTSDGSIQYGTIPSSTSKNTIQVSDTQTIQNNGSSTINLVIKTSNATGGTQWTLGSSPGNDIFVKEFSTNSGSNWTQFTTVDTYQSLSSSVTPTSSVNFDLQITVPSVTTDYQQKSITITVMAVLP